jgi:hypothetical protein
MRIRSWSLLALALLALGQFSCATLDLTPMEESMPAARAWLPPEYRIFYDALQDYGDWTLIEPFGYVFRPYGNVVGWRPYQDGYWVASDVYGWVWVSAEPFGWATYHYGDWLYDRYQGWVWIPGLDWGPAWVSWEETPDYIGWAPLFPAGFSTGLVPGGEYLYVPTAELVDTDLRTRVRTRDQVGGQLGAPRPIENPLEHDGITFNAGPRFERIERLTGPLPRVKIEDLFPAAGPGTKPGSRPDRPAAPVPRKEPVARTPAARPAPPAPGTSPADVQAMRRAAAEAARQARSVTERRSAPPASVGIVRPEVKRGPGLRESARGKARETGRERAEADSTKKP